MKKELDGQIFYENTAGALVPEENVKPQDLLRDDLVNSIVSDTFKLREQLINMKKEFKNKIDNYVAICASRYGVKIGGPKDGLALTSYDGRYRIVIASNNVKGFNENINIAKQVLDEYLTEEVKSSSNDIKTLITAAFKVKQGVMDFNSIMRLTQINITHPKYQKAMQIIKDSVQIVTTAPSFRVYARNENGEYNYLKMDFATIG